MRSNQLSYTPQCGLRNDSYLIESPLQTTDTDNDLWFDFTPEPPSSCGDILRTTILLSNGFRACFIVFFQSLLKKKAKICLQNCRCKLIGTLAAFSRGLIAVFWCETLGLSELVFISFRCFVSFSTVLGVAKRAWPRCIPAGFSILPQAREPSRLSLPDILEANLFRFRKD